MIRFLVVTALAALLGWAAAAQYERKTEKRQRAVAVEEACRTIVEAGLVRSCTVQK